MALVLVLVAGCKKSKESQCDDLAKLGVTIAEEMGKSLGGKSGAGNDPEIRAKMAELKAQCMTWPDEVFECMRENDETSPKCKEAMTHVTGVTSSNLEKAPDGPPVVARKDLGEPGWNGLRLTLAADGTVTALVKGAVVAVDATGTERWRSEIDHADWMVAMPGEIIVGDREEHAIVALDPASGAAKWRIAVPSVEEYGERSTEGAVRIGNGLYVAIADGRFLRVDPAACAKPKQKGCIETAFTLADESFDDVDMLAMGDEIVIGESTGIRRLSTKGEVTAHVHVRDGFGGFALAEDGKLAAVMDDELVIWNLAQCPRTPVALSRKQGRMYLRGEGDCDDCSAPPAGCLVARSELSDVHSMAPHPLKDGSIAISNMDGPARVAPNGNKHWVSEVDSVGPMRELGDNIVFVSRDEDEKPARVVALSTKTGKAAWMSALDDKSDDISSTTDTTVDIAGPWLVVGVKGKISWIKVQ